MAAAEFVDPPAAADDPAGEAFDSELADAMDLHGLATSDIARAIGEQATPAAVRAYVTRTKGTPVQLCEMAAEIKRRHVAAGVR